MAAVDVGADRPHRRSARSRNRRSEPIESGPLVAAARELIAPEAGSAYAQRYHAALQELPEAVLAHRDLVVLLKLQRPASNA